MTNARDLSARLAQLLRTEHGAMAEFLVALADFDRRRLWLDLGHPSLFSFLTRELHLSAGAAQYRKTACELVRSFPEVVEPLRDGRLCISTVFEVAKVLTPENLDELLPRFFGLSKREAMAVAAEIQPREAAPHRTVVSAIRTASAVAPSTTARPDPAGANPAMVFRPVETAPAPVPAEVYRPVAEKRDEAVPLTADLRRLHVTVSRHFLEKVDAARDALSHSHPGASIEEILEVGLDLVLERSARRKGLVKKPLKLLRQSKGDGIPAHVRRAVWIRDGGKCQWPLQSGGICGSTYRVEVDHIEEKARGGPPGVENTRLVCDVHNIRKARVVFGDAWMDRFTRKARRDDARPPGGPSEIPASG